MSRVEMPQNTRVVDLLQVARSQGKRLVWRPEPFRQSRPPEDTHAHNSPVNRMRPGLHVVAGNTD